MIHAYDEIYLPKAQVSLALMLRFAVQDLEYEPDRFFEYFIESGIANCFGNGDYRYTVGMSGIELACEVIQRILGYDCQKMPTYSLEKSDIYWTGWALAYYQWYSAHTFSDIYQYVKVSDIVKMYVPYHEMDIMQLVEALDQRVPSVDFRTRLYEYRKRAGYSQRKLADFSGISVRMIQNYEQRSKDINKAQVDTLWKLSDTLGCGIEDLLERPGQRRI